MKQFGKPTSAELEILSVLWETGPASVREVFARLSEQKSTTYTTVLKFMQIMHEKGFVKRDEKNKAHIYRAAITQEQTQRGLVKDLLDKAFRGSALSLVQHVLETKPASHEELAEIKRLIADAEAKENRK